MPRPAARAFSCLQAAQAHDAGDNRITAASIWGEDLARRAQTPEDRARRGILTDLRGDLEFAERCGETAGPISESKA